MLEQCSSQIKNPIQRTGDIVLTLIRHDENTRDIDFCSGLSSNIGYFTAKSCCEADQIMVFDVKTYAEISMNETTIYLDDNICFISKANKSEINFPNFDLPEKRNCSILAYDEVQEQFNYYHLNQLELLTCFNAPCSLQIDPNSIQNATVLIGSPIFCEKSGHFGIITTG